MTLSSAQQDCVAAKVLRRAEISRMTRLLKSRLTLATYKTSRGWQNLALENIAPRLTQEVKLSKNHRSDPFIVPTTQSEYFVSKKRSHPTENTPVWSNRVRLHQSSPVHKNHSVDPFLSSNYLNTYHLIRPTQSSPPRTPPYRPSMRTMTPHTGEEGVDLLIYLATSPSHASLSTRFPPNTPQNFDFSDFVNITPSPAQVAWSSRTPGSTPARKKLTYDQTLPLSSSPATPGPTLRVDTGSMELGGELSI
ncbi:hypothetical protein T552_00222 [Pneumocystis carinii B80]|uniref:Uncharacterized protein n=1 Tax=Pneumocystis carinii (strain B80) TaxID=1408658 RepID=A0A0W4ZTA4_PNEC8|nr:hypothetical protein T552_00222 [Pneumocystis carinii B80]KTW31584.1 hypothetical protein T552_00222 [Pneumocystis carinii B80]